MKIRINIDLGPNGGVLELAAKLARLTSEILRIGRIAPVSADGVEMRVTNIEYDQHDRQLAEAMWAALDPKH